MGDVARTIFGGPEQSDSASVSDNRNYQRVTNAFSPAMGYTTQGGNMMGNLLGLGGGPAQTEGLTNFANSGGMEFLREQGRKGITSSKAASGLLNSGSYGTALTKYNQGLASTYLNQYMGHLSDFAKIGLGAGGLVNSAGQYSKSESDSEGEKGGILPMVASFAGGVA